MTSSWRPHRWLIKSYQPRTAMSSRLPCFRNNQEKQVLLTWTIRLSRLCVCKLRFRIRKNHWRRVSVSQLGWQQSPLSAVRACVRIRGIHVRHPVRLRSADSLSKHARRALIHTQARAIKGRSAWMAAERAAFAFRGLVGPGEAGECQSLPKAFIGDQSAAPRSELRANGDAEAWRPEARLEDIAGARSIGALSAMPRRELARAWESAHRVRVRRDLRPPETDSSSPRFLASRALQENHTYRIAKPGLAASGVEYAAHIRVTIEPPSLSTMRPRYFCDFVSSVVNSFGFSPIANRVGEEWLRIMHWRLFRIKSEWNVIRENLSSHDCIILVDTYRYIQNETGMKYMRKNTYI